MASLSKDGKSWRIRFLDGGGQRHGIRLPGFKKSEADVVLSRVKELIAARIGNQAIATVTAAWLAGIDERLRKRLEVVGLVNPPETTEDEAQQIESPTLSDFLASFVVRGKTVEGMPASKETTNKWRGTKDLLLDCFDGNRTLDTFTLADGREFREWMEHRKIAKNSRSPSGRMSENSMRQRMANCKTFFNYAVSEEPIANNPFRRQHSSTVKVEAGKINIPSEVVYKVIDAAPNAQWRLLIALWRYAGLRKMEPMHLRWSDVNWAEGKLRVTSTKTSHHEGKAIRYVPIRDIERYLLDAVELAEDDDRIINMYRPTMSNLNKPLVQIIGNAGIDVWPNLIKNLRMSCENDWLTRKEAPAHAIAAWMGHSVDVQNSHYAMVSDGHFETFNNRQIERGPFPGPVDHGNVSQNVAGGPDTGPKSLRLSETQQKHYSKLLPQGLEP